MKVEAAITIHQTPEVVFPYLSDPEKMIQWMPVKNVRLLTDGPVGVGSKFSLTASFLGQSAEIITEITAYDEPKLLAFKAPSGPVPFERGYTLSPTDEGTQLVMVAEGEPGGFFKLAQPLLASAVNKQVHDQLNKLKQLLES